jgi:integrase
MAKVNRRQQGEGSLYQRKRDSRWVAVADLGWKDGRRDRREFTAATSAAAVARRAEFLDRRRNGFTLPKGRPPTVGEWAHHWLHKIIKNQVQETSWKAYRAHTELHIIPYFARTPLTGSSVTEEVIEEWHAHLERKGLSATTIGLAHGNLSQILKLAVRRGHLQRNPASDAHPPARSTREAVPPEDDEVRAILAACEDWRTGPRWITGLATGARQGEALGLLWPLADIDDPAAAAVRIEWSLARLPWQHGCEDPRACGQHRRSCPPGCERHATTCPQRHGGGLILKRPKTEKARRVIPIGRPAALALKRQRQLQLEERLVLGPAWAGWAHHCDRKPRRRDVVCPDCRMPYRPDALVFTQPNGRPVDHRADLREWGALLEACGLGHYRIHDGRHGVATSLLEGGIEIRVVQEIMGHANPDFTRRTYQHVRPALKREAAEVLGRRMWGER